MGLAIIERRFYQRSKASTASLGGAGARQRTRVSSLLESRRVSAASLIYNDLFYKVTHWRGLCGSSCIVVDTAPQAAAVSSQLSGGKFGQKRTPTARTSHSTGRTTSEPGTSRIKAYKPHFLRSGEAAVSRLYMALAVLGGC